MSDPLGRHYCKEAKDLDDFGYTFCSLFKKKVRCYGLDEDCLEEYREEKARKDSEESLKNLAEQQESEQIRG